MCINAPPAPRGHNLQELKEVKGESRRPSAGIYSETVNGQEGWAGVEVGILG